MIPVENDDASLFIDLFAENFPSPGLGEQAQPPPYPTRWLFNHGDGGLTWNPVTEIGSAENAAAAAAALTESEISVVNHNPQRNSDNDSVNTECNLVLDMAGGMMMSPSPSSSRRNYFSDSFLMPNLAVNMGGGMMMSPSRMNYFSGEEAVDMPGGMMMSPSPSSSRRNYFSDSFLMPNLAVNMGGGMMMSPSRMNYFSGEETVDMPGGMMMSPSPSSSRRNYFSDSFLMPNLAVNMGGGMMMSPPRMNYFSGEEAVFPMPNFQADMPGGMMNSSLPSGDSIGNSDPFGLWNYSEVQQLENGNGMMQPAWLRDWLYFCMLTISVPKYFGFRKLFWETIAEAYLRSFKCVSQNMVLVVELIFGEQNVRIFGEEIVRINVKKKKKKKGDLKFDFSWAKSYDAACSSLALEVRDYGIKTRYIQKLGTALEENHTAEIWLKEWCRGVVLQQHHSSCSEGPIPKSSATNEERNNVPMLLNGLRGSSRRSGALNRLSFINYWRFSRVLNRLVTACRPVNWDCLFWDMVKTPTKLLSEWRIPKSSATNEERNPVVVVDAIGNSSNKKDIIWCQNDHGFTHKFLEKQFVSPDTLKPPHQDFGITRCSLEEVGTTSGENHTADIWPAIEAQRYTEGMMLLQQEDLSSEPHIPESSTATNEEINVALEENHTADIWHALEAQCRGGGIQDYSSSEAHIPKSSATNEETNVVVELKSNDPKGGNSSSSEKTDAISRWEKDHGITRQVLEQLFGKSRDDAAKTLKVSTSTLKRACRDFGINRWPNQSKGKRPICSLNQQEDVQAVKKHKGVQPCPVLPPLQGTSTSQCYSTMSVKVTYQNDTIRFPLSPSSTMKYLEEQLETKLKISLQNMSIKYQDEEDEWITLTCDSELLHGLDVLRSCGKTIIRMMVTQKFD